MSTLLNENAANLHSVDVEVNDQEYTEPVKSECNDMFQTIKTICSNLKEGLTNKMIRAEITGSWCGHFAASRIMLPYFSASGHSLYLKSEYA